MPWEWDIAPDQGPDQAPASPGAFSHAAGQRPRARLHLWPYRSLPRRGFVAVIGLAFTLLLLPLLALVGSLLLWGMLPFVLTALAALWFFLEKSYRDGEILEELTIWDDLITLDRHGPAGAHQHWQANPYWTTVQLYPTGGPVPDYLTLKGGGREVELGAFLSEDERAPLCHTLRQILAHTASG